MAEKKNILTYEGRRKLELSNSTRRIFSRPPGWARVEVPTLITTRIVHATLSVLKTFVFI